LEQGGRGKEKKGGKGVGEVGGGGKQRKEFGAIPVTEKTENHQKGIPAMVPEEGRHPPWRENGKGKAHEKKDQKKSNAALPGES